MMPSLLLFTRLWQRIWYVLIHLILIATLRGFIILLILWMKEETHIQLLAQGVPMHLRFGNLHLC